MACMIKILFKNMQSVLNDIKPFGILVHRFLLGVKTFALNKIKHIPYFSFLVSAHDAVMSFFSLFLTLYLKIGDEFFNYTSEFLLKNIFVFVLISMGTYIALGTYKALWKFISIEDLSRLNLSIIIAHALYFPSMILLAGDESFSVFVPLINVLVTAFLLNTSRIIGRMMHDKIILKRKKSQSIISIPIIIVGDEEPAELFIRDIKYSSDLPFDPIGIVTVKGTHEEGQSIHNVPILGHMNDLCALVKELSIKPRQLVIADSNVTEKMMKKLTKMAHDLEMIPLKMMSHFSLDVVKESVQELPENKKTKPKKRKAS